MSGPTVTFTPAPGSPWRQLPDEDDATPEPAWLSRFAKIPARFIHDPRITLNDYRVYAALRLHSFKNDACHPKKSTLAEIVGILDNKIAHHTRRLERMGWIRKIGNGGRSCPATYIVFDAPQLETGPETVPLFQDKKGSQNRTKTGPKTGPLLPLKGSQNRTPQAREKRIEREGGETRARHEDTAQPIHGSEPPPPPDDSFFQKKPETTAHPMLAAWRATHTDDATILSPRMRKEAQQVIDFVVQQDGDAIAWPKNDATDIEHFFKRLFDTALEYEWFSERDFSYWLSTDHVVDFINKVNSGQDWPKLNALGRERAYQARLSRPDPLATPQAPLEPAWTHEQETVLNVIDEGADDEVSIAQLCQMSAVKVKGVCIQLMRNGAIQTTSPGRWAKGLRFPSLPIRRSIPMHASI